MQESPGQKKNEVADLLKKHRQEMEARRQQQADFEERLQLIRQRKQALRIIKQDTQKRIRTVFMRMRLK
jgi:hypothetical protein